MSKGEGGGEFGEKTLAKLFSWMRLGAGDLFLFLMWGGTYFPPPPKTIFFSSGRGGGEGRGEEGGEGAWAASITASVAVAVAVATDISCSSGFAAPSKLVARTRPSQLSEKTADSDCAERRRCENELN